VKRRRWLAPEEEYKKMARARRGKEKDGSRQTTSNDKYLFRSHVPSLPSDRWLVKKKGWLAPEGKRKMARAKTKNFQRQMSLFRSMAHARTGK
jgi:hypothetical protein